MKASIDEGERGQVHGDGAAVDGEDGAIDHAGLRRGEEADRLGHLFWRRGSPERYVARIAPRPIVMVNGIDDPQMPRTAVEALYDAAREPKALVWLHTGHLEPTDSALIRALVDTALARLPVLHGSRP